MAAVLLKPRSWQKADISTLDFRSRYTGLPVRVRIKLVFYDFFLLELFSYISTRKVGIEAVSEVPKRSNLV